MTKFNFVSDVYGFDHPLHALEFLKNQRIDVATLDIEMFLLNRLELATQCKNNQSEPPALYCTPNVRQK